MPATYTNIDHGTFHWVMMTVQWNLITALWELEDKLNVPRTRFIVNGHPMPNIANYILWHLPLDAAYTLPDIYQESDYAWVVDQRRLAGLSKAECIQNLQAVYDRIEQLITTWVEGSEGDLVAWYTGPYGDAEEDTLSNRAGRHLVRITKYADRFIHYDSLVDYAEEACGISELEYPSCCWNARMGKSWTDAALLLNNIRHAAVLPWTQVWYEMEGMQTQRMTEGDLTVIPPILPELSGYANDGEWIWNEDALEEQVQTWWEMFYEGHAMAAEDFDLGWNYYDAPGGEDGEVEGQWWYEGGALLWATFVSRAYIKYGETFLLGNYFEGVVIDQVIPYEPLALVMPSYVQGTLNAGSVPVHFGWSDNFDGDVTVTLRINELAAGSITLPEGWDSILRNQPLDQNVPMTFSVDIEVPDAPPWDWEYEMPADQVIGRFPPPASEGDIVASEGSNGFFLARLNPLNANTWTMTEDEDGDPTLAKVAPDQLNYGICYIITL